MAGPASALGYVDDAGYAYTGGYGELVDALLEFVPDLLWPQSIRTYTKMRVDPQIGGVLKAYTLPLRRASWAVDPAGCRPEVYRFLADEVGLPVLGEMDQPSGARRRHVTWHNHARLALLSLVFGHMPFERTYEYDGRLLRIGQMSERMPQTISQILLNPDGSLDGIKQNALSGAKASEKIPSDALVWYAVDREGSNWTGRSLLRAAYGPWLLKHELWRVHATSIRRFGMGVPSVEAPPGATPAQVAEAARIAQSIRAGDQAGAGLPPGFRLALTGITGSTPDALGFIQYLDQQMTRNTLTGLLDLGSTETGSRALGDTFLDLFMLSLQTIGDDLADQATSQIFVPLVDLNWGEDEPVPRIVCSDLSSDKEITAETLKLLIESGALTADPDLEHWLRRTYKLPEKPEGLPGTSTARVSSPAAATPRARKVAAAGLSRGLTEVEAASKADFLAIQADWESDLASLMDDWGAVSSDQMDEIEAGVEDAVSSGNLSALGALPVSSAAGVPVLKKAMEKAAQEAAARAKAEAVAQGASVGKFDIDEDKIGALAEAYAELSARGLAAFSGRAALQHLTSDAAGVASAVREAYDGLTGSTLQDSLGSALSVAQNEGRVAVFSAAPEATYYASEVLDTATCQACRDIDGKAFGSLEEAQTAYASGGYSECEGGLRCRGIIVAVWS